MPQDTAPPSERGSINPTASASIVPQALRALVESQIERGKETFESLSAAAHHAYTTNLKNADEYGKKLIEVGQRDSEDVFDCWRRLLVAKSPAEMIEVWTSHAPRQLQSISNRTGELWTLLSRMATEAAKPVANGAANPALK